MKESIHELDDQLARLNKPGVTLTELLVVLAIIGVLTAIITPIYINTVDGAHRVKCTHQLQSIGSAVLAYEVEHGRLPGPLYYDDGWEFTLQARLLEAGYSLHEDLWVCPANDGRRESSVLAKGSTYVVNNSSATSPLYFFGERDRFEPSSLGRILAHNPDGVWLIRDRDVVQVPMNSVFTPDESPGMPSRKRPPHAKGRNYFFADGHVEHIKFGAFPVER